MNGQSDILVIQDLHFTLWQEYEKTKAPIHESRIRTFLAARTPAYNVENIFKLMLSSKIITLAGLEVYIPGAKNTLTYE
jgi:hypothetical protein